VIHARREKSEEELEKKEQERVKEVIISIKLQHKYNVKFISSNIQNTNG